MPEHVPNPHSPADGSAAEPPRRANPLWAINAGLAAFLVIVALIMMMS